MRAPRAPPPPLPFPGPPPSRSRSFLHGSRSAFSGLSSTSRGARGSGEGTATRLPPAGSRPRAPAIRETAKPDGDGRDARGSQAPGRAQLPPTPPADCPPRPPSRRLPLRSPLCNTEPLLYSALPQQVWSFNTFTKKLRQEKKNQKGRQGGRVEAESTAPARGGLGSGPHGPS